ncbi:hypothetical protein GCM10023313_11420 [Mucilaginibacter defluvii]|uniref:Acyl carrier protein n=1 Tax=Mucilaginibacter defluvii TaxID=1196019 RepID=A0ABP9FUT5_9SPHI
MQAERAVLQVISGIEAFFRDVVPFADRAEIDLVGGDLFGHQFAFFGLLIKEIAKELRFDRHGLQKQQQAACDQA